jgi:hypothetical protein
MGISDKKKNKNSIKPFYYFIVLPTKHFNSMRKLITMLFVVLGMTTGFSQENNPPEFTGDNFSLEGALALFKKASSLEEFEKMLNQEDNNVNNLDLNGDGNIDYINVEDIKENNTHVIVLSTFLKDNDKQDIATIGIEKTDAKEATLQIEGDEELYAANTIAEPSELEQKMKTSKGGPAIGTITTTRLFVNVWLWPCVRFVYAPSYVVWVSPYRWNNHPRWWRPWRPFRHSVFYTRCAPHRVYYHRTPTRRLIYVRNIYAPRRHHSTIVVHGNNRTTVIKNDRRGNVKVVKKGRVSKPKNRVRRTER